MFYNIQKWAKDFFFFPFFLLLFLANISFASTNQNELTLSISSNPSRINPILATDSASGEIAGKIFNGLFKYNKAGKIVCDLAKSYKFITPTKLKIKLRKNILWSDKVPFSAKDVIFTYDTLMDKNIYTPYKTPFLKIKSIKQLDKYTLEINYKEPYFKALNIWMTGILPYHILKDEKNLMTSKFNKHPIGTGSYTLKSFVPSKDIILQANQNYFGNIPKIKTIRYKFIPDPNTAFTMLNQDKIDMDSLTPLQLDRQLKSNFKQHFSIYEQPSFGYTYMGFNLKSKKFKNKKIREAISLAIDKQQIVDILFLSHGKPCIGPFLPNTFAYNDKVKLQAPNIKKSIALLKELGYDKNHRFSFTVVTNANNALRVNATQIIQYQLQKVGIDMKIRILEWQAFLNTVVMPKRFDAIILGWGLSLMPDARSIWHSESYKKGGFNFIGYSNKIVDEDIELAEKTTDFKKIGKLYKEIFKQITDDIPYIFLYIPNNITAISKKIQNVSPSIIGVTHNQDDWIKE